ncbi:MAG: glycosyltransferase family 4 protein, partial [Planctomycetaceae bacterium]|nr:glycosyltransferase family 4 protein [Planctomycetaceae bacterium]
MTKQKLIFDIANLSQSGQSIVVGVPRFIIEILKRLIESEKFDIVTICSLPEEEFALRNLKRFLPIDIPFQSKNVEHYILPDKPTSTKKSFLSKIEETLKNCFPESNFLKWIISTCRAVKWRLFPPPFRVEHKLSPFYERLVENSDIYFSPSYSFIPELVFNPTIRKVLCVHDMIPIILADMYKNRVFFQTDPWESITPDTIVLADSESTKRDLLKYYPNVLQEQVTTILLAADNRFSPCFDRNKIESTLNKYSIPTNIHYILSVATFDIRKNFDHVMNCFAKYSLSPNGIETNCHLVLTGTSGWQDKKFKKVFTNLPKNVKEKIIFTGYVDDDDLPLLYSGATCFCYMSIYEGFGLPPLEAMQCGTPVITSNTSSLPEVVGDAGIMLDPHDVEGLADAFMQVI